jgi:hypothetical protein
MAFKSKPKIDEPYVRVAESEERRHHTLLAAQNKSASWIEGKPNLQSRRES